MTADPAPPTSSEAPAPPTAPPRRGLLRRLAARAATVGRIVLHFTGRGRWFLLPLVLVLLLSAVLLALTSGLSYVAPFVYTIF